MTYKNKNVTVARATKGRTPRGAEQLSQSTMDGLRPLADPFHPGEDDGNLEVIDEEDSSVVSAENNNGIATPSGPGSPLVENRPLRERTPAPEDHGYSLDVHPSLQFLSGLIDQLRTRIENLEIEMARIRNTVHDYSGDYYRPTFRFVGRIPDQLIREVRRRRRPANHDEALDVDSNASASSSPPQRPRRPFWRKSRFLRWIVRKFH